MSTFSGAGQGRFPQQGNVNAPPASPPLFNPDKPKAELVNELAEKQADLIQDMTSAQLRKFFGEVKDLYRRLNQNQSWAEAIDPQFRMLRSKVYYAKHKVGRQNGVPQSFVQFVENGVKMAKTQEQFEAFVQHFEAVVGFWYGKYDRK